MSEKSREGWHRDSWRSKVAAQQPNWPDEKELGKCIDRITELPPLVFAGEIRSLKKELASAQKGECFLLQGGDCAEDFSRCNAVSIREQLKVILQMSIVLTFGASKPVIKLGRIAGQYAKPRSKDLERIDGIDLPAYRGDCVNLPEFTKDSRIPNPERLLQGYFHSAATLNLLRAFVNGGFADLHKVHMWNKESLNESNAFVQYENIANKIEEALNFMNACGINPDSMKALREVDFYTSHEALLLNYESALTRQDSLTDRWYDCSAHFVWIGDRTRQVDGAHMEYFRGIRNPVGIKLGPNMTGPELSQMLDILNPDNEEGRITLITRMGHEAINDKLPGLVEQIEKEKRTVLWSCDPMHANTFVSSSGLKTRQIEHVINEIKGFFNVHKKLGTVAGGIHLELTGDDVTEVVGGKQNIGEHQLKDRYFTNCDPRLNCRQGLEIAFEIAEMLAE